MERRLLPEWTVRPVNVFVTRFFVDPFMRVYVPGKDEVNLNRFETHLKVWVTTTNYRFVNTST